MIRHPAVLASMAALIGLVGCDSPIPATVVPESDAGPSTTTGVDKRNPIIINSSNTPPASVAMTPPTAADADATAQLSHILHGMNIGNYMDQPGNSQDKTQSQCSPYAPAEGAGAGGGNVAGWMFDAIKFAGFDHVRLTINWNCHTGHDPGASPNDIDAAWFARIDWAIAHTLGRGMVMVIDMHNYWDYLNLLPGERDKLVSLWTQIAEHYKNYPKELYFEVLNEPQYGFDETIWGTDLAKCIQAIRATNPYRTIIFGGTDYNKAYTLTRLQSYLPANDTNLIATVHYYSPYCFTLQQAWDCPKTYGNADSTSSTTVKWPIPFPDNVDADAGTLIADKMMGLVNSDFDSAAAAGQQLGRPIYIGEFGAMDKQDLTSRAAYIHAVVQASESRGMGWANWGFVNTQLDAWKGTVGWFEPIINALRPDYTPTY